MWNLSGFRPFCVDLGNNTRESPFSRFSLNFWCRKPFHKNLSTPVYRKPGLGLNSVSQDGSIAKTYRAFAAPCPDWKSSSCGAKFLNVGLFDQCKLIWGGLLDQYVILRLSICIESAMRINKRGHRSLWRFGSICAHGHRWEGVIWLQNNNELISRVTAQLWLQESD